MAGRWFSPGTLISSTNKTDHHNVTEILLKVALNTITLTTKHLLMKTTFFFNCSSSLLLATVQNETIYCYTLMNIFLSETGVTILATNYYRGITFFFFHQKSEFIRFTEEELYSEVLPISPPTRRCNS